MRAEDGLYDLQSDCILDVWVLGNIDVVEGLFRDHKSSYKFSTQPTTIKLEFDYYGSMHVVV